VTAAGGGRGRAAGRPRRSPGTLAGRSGGGSRQILLWCSPRRSEHPGRQAESVVGGVGPSRASLYRSGHCRRDHRVVTEGTMRKRAGRFPKREGRSRHSTIAASPSCALSWRDSSPRPLRERYGWRWRLGSRGHNHLCVAAAPPIATGPARRVSGVMPQPAGYAASVSGGSFRVPELLEALSRPRADILQRKGGLVPALTTTDGRDCRFVLCFSWTTARHFLCFAAPRERQALSQTTNGPPRPFRAGEVAVRASLTRGPRGPKENP
jgi:hypothetical protein